MAGRKNVVFVSEKNACRSIIAQAYAQKLGFDKFDSQSFGLHPDRLHYLVQEFLKDNGVDTTFYFSKAYEVIERRKIDLLILMNPSLKDQLPQIDPKPDIEVWEFEDPARKDIPESDMSREIEELAVAIQQKVKNLVERYN
jgi:arsenate reductase (thioredoxin)